jgi:hypothetical protein
MMPRKAKELKYCPSCQLDKPEFEGDKCPVCRKEERKAYPARCYSPVYDGQYWPPQKKKTKKEE